jgi:hypothetical protein
LFNVTSISIALRVAYQAYNIYPDTGLSFDFPLRLFCTAVAYFVMNTLPVSIVIHLTDSKPLMKTWKETYFWAFSYYLVGAIFAGVYHGVADLKGWHTAVLILPVVYAVYRSYSFYISNLAAEKVQAETERQHAEQMSSLHLRTIQALALAIEAKDQTTHDHLQRVQLYSVEVAKALGLRKRDQAVEPPRSCMTLASSRFPNILFQNQQADPGGIREDEDPSGGRRRDSGTCPVPLCGGSDSPPPSRKVGRHRLPGWPER